jgi:Plasmid encoded RepA protein
MGEVHQLILREGLEGARSIACTRADRQAVEAAAAVMAEEVSRLGITHAGFAMTSLPHKRIEEPLWRRQGHRATLLVESGRTGTGDWIGVPYGSVARLILLYLQTEAIRTSSPEVELGRSMHAWLSRMGISAGGKNYKLVLEQARRISACRLTFLTEIPGAELRQNGAFVQDAITLTAATDERQRALWQDRVRLDNGFWRSLREHPVPVREEAVRAIGARSLALDVYIWLAYRLHVLTKATPVGWTPLHAQFGAPEL